MANPTTIPSMQPAQPSPGFPYASPIYLVDQYGNPFSSSNPMPVVGPISLADGSKASYSAAILGLAPASSPTDIFSIQGSATKLVRVTRLIFSALQTTAGNIDVRVIKRSGGTQSAGTAMTIVPNDSNNATATAVPATYTANPASLGTSLGDVFDGKVFVPAAATGASPTRLELVFGNGPAQAQVLRGITQFLTVHLNGVTLTGGSIDLFVEFTEE